jgi:putative mRNA 3-end processing factor
MCGTLGDALDQDLDQDRLHVGEALGLGLELREAGLHLRGLGLWLDPAAPCAGPAFASHAHALAADEAGGVIASPETIALARALGSGVEARPLGWDEALELPIDAAYGGGTARLTTAPSGHVLGGAQLVVDHPGGRLVYTGDWCGEADGTHAPGVIVECDELVVTSTFALPIFKLDAPARALAAVAGWCRDRLAEGTTPVVLAQTPGPAQAVARALLADGQAVAVWDEVLRACAAYAEMGVPMGELRPYDPTARGAAVVAPAGARAVDARRRGRVAVAYVSGWATLDAAVEQKRADAAFALAGQADHDALVRLVEASGARRVHAVRGDARAFARMLRARGVRAGALESAPIDERGAS